MKLPETCSPNEEAFESSWNRCSAILEHYKHQIHSAPFAGQVLETLRKNIQLSQEPEKGTCHTLKRALGPATDIRRRYDSAARESGILLGNAVNLLGAYASDARGSGPLTRF